MPNDYESFINRAAERGNRQRFVGIYEYMMGADWRAARERVPREQLPSLNLEELQRQVVAIYQQRRRESMPNDNIANQQWMATSTPTSLSDLERLYNPVPVPHATAMPEPPPCGPCELDPRVPNPPCWRRITNEEFIGDNDPRCWLVLTPCTDREQARAIFRASPELKVIRCVAQQHEVWRKQVFKKKAETKPEGPTPNVRHVPEPPAMTESNSGVGGQACGAQARAEDVTW